MAKVTRSKPKSTISNASWNLGWSIWSAILSFIMIPILIRYIGDSHYGIYVLFASINSVMGILNLGLGEATLRFVAVYYGKDDLDGINRVVGSTLLIYCCSGFIGFLILFILAPFIADLISVNEVNIDLITTLIKVTAFSFSLNLINGVLEAIPKALQRYEINTIVKIIQSSLIFIGNLLIVHFNKGVLELVLWSTFSILIVSIINYFVALHVVPSIKLFPRFSRKGVKEIFGYGFYSMLTSALGLVWGQADRLLVGSLVSPASVAYLSAPQSVVMRGSAAVGNAGSVLFPKFAMISDTESRKKLYLDSTWFFSISTIVIFVPLTILIPNILNLWLGTEFAAKSEHIGQLIAFSCIPRGAFIPYDSLFKGIGKPKYLTLLYSVTGATSLLANIFLIKKYGLVGAGYSYIFTLFWGFCTVYLTWNKIFKESNYKPLMRAVLFPLIFGMILLVVYYFISNLLGPKGWIEVIITMASFVLFLSVLLISLDYLLGKKDWHFRPVFNYILRFVNIGK